MSKKNNQTDVVMTERQRAEAKEAKSLKIMTFSFVIIVVLCLSILVGSVAINPIKNVIYKNTKAITIGDTTLSAVELNYFYVDAISNYLNTLQKSYGDYWYLFSGIDTTKALDKQTYTYKDEDDKEVTKTWAEVFLETAIENATSTYELYNLAQKDGFKLSEDRQKSIDSTMLTMGFYASYYGFKNLDGYLVNSYGNGATEESYRNYYTVCRIAEDYYAHHAESLEYDEEAIRAYDKDEEHLGIYSSYTYNYYLFSATAFREGGTKDDKGNMTYTDEEKKAAIETAKKLADELAAGTYEDVEAFDKALNEILKAYEDSKKTATSAEETTAPSNPTDPTEPSTPSDDKEEDKDDKEEDKEEDKNKKSSTKADDVLGSKANALFLEWLADAERAEGDLKVFEVSTGEGENKVISGYYVLRFEKANDNMYELVNVRHLLVKFEGGKYNSTTGKTTYTDAEKKAAKMEAERLLKQWEEGEKTEESLIELIKKNSDDGNASTGGLYEDIVPGYMVESFNDWCFDAERKVGDYDIVETEFGYHIVYFSGRSETLYRNYLITEDMRTEDTAAWHEELVDKAVVTIITDKYVDKGMKLS